MTKAQEVIDALRAPRVGDLVTFEVWASGMTLQGTVVGVDECDEPEGGMCVVQSNEGFDDRRLTRYRRFVDEITVL